MRFALRHAFSYARAARRRLPCALRMPRGDVATRAHICHAAMMLHYADTPLADIEH